MASAPPPPRRGFRLRPAWLALGLIAGCAAEPWSYGKAGVTPARLDQDLEACRREAYRPNTFALSRSGRVDQGAVKQCMERKGYSARRDS